MHKELYCVQSNLEYCYFSFSSQIVANDIVHSASLENMQQHANRRNYKTDELIIQIHCCPLNASAHFTSKENIAGEKKLSSFKINIYTLMSRGICKGHIWQTKKKGFQSRWLNE